MSTKKTTSTTRTDFDQEGNVLTITETVTIEEETPKPFTWPDYSYPYVSYAKGGYVNIKEPILGDFKVA